jgi:hypothetical protein
VQGDNTLLKAVYHARDRYQKIWGPENLVIDNLPDPIPAAGQVLIQVKGFGLNHAEMHMRKGEWAEAMPVIGHSKRQNGGRSLNPGGISNDCSTGL